MLEVARLAGIMAAKRTGDLIPLCHPLGLDAVELDLDAGRRRDASRIEATVKVHGRTGVEMEALTAVSVAALTVYDMCKAVDRGMVIDAGPARREVRRPERPLPPRAEATGPADRRDGGDRPGRIGRIIGRSWDVLAIAAEDRGDRPEARGRSTPRSPPSWPRPSGSSRPSWGAGSRSCNTSSTTAPTSGASGSGRRWCS